MRKERDTLELIKAYRSEIRDDIVERLHEGNERSREVLGFQHRHVVDDKCHHMSEKIQHQ